MRLHNPLRRLRRHPTPQIRTPVHSQRLILWVRREHRRPIHQHPEWAAPDPNLRLGPDPRPRLRRMEQDLNLRNKMGRILNLRNHEFLNLWRRLAWDGGRRRHCPPSLPSSNRPERLLRHEQPNCATTCHLRLSAPKQLQSLITPYAGCASWPHHCEYRSGQG